MNIQPITTDDRYFVSACAQFLMDLFPQTHEWRTLEGALAEIHDILGEGGIFVALKGHDVLGCVGYLPIYDGHVWEVHPLCIDKTRQAKGIGSALLCHLEARAREQGIDSLFLGTDDEDNRTTLSQIENLYDDPLGHIARLANLDEANPHPFSFYQKVGFTVVGILPDANGKFKPDIFMSKKVTQRSC